MAESMEIDNPEPTESLGDVFIVYSSKDREMVVKTIYPKLKDHNFTVYYDNDFQPGKSVFENISDAVHKCKKTLIYLTKNSLESTWCRFELLISLEKTQKTNIHSVVLLLDGLDQKQVSTIGFLRIAPKVEMDTGEVWIDSLASALREDISVGDVLPAGNVGHGQAHSHFNGYLQYVLPELEEKVRQCEWYKADPRKMPIVMFEMISQSCKCPTKFEEADPENIKKVGDLEQIVVQRAGNYRRISVPVYSIKDSDGTEYYCVAEYPAVIQAMYLMQENHLATITDEERRLQLVRFYFTMNAIFHHSNLKNVAGRAKLLLFNDDQENPRDVLLRGIKGQLTGQDTEKDPLSRLLSGSQKTDKDSADGVFIMNQSHSDENICCEIQSSLKSMGFSCSTSMDDPGKTNSKRTIEGLQRCRWCILICSRKIHMNMQFLMSIQQCVKDNNICLIPVLKDVDPSEIPESLSWITLIQANDRKYLQKIEYALKDLPIELETLLPAGNVSDGLAWGYVVNYLEFLLKGLPSEIKNAFGEETSYVCPEKLLILLPKSCFCYQSLEEADEQKRITKHKHIVVVERTMAGMKGRQYHCDIYKIENYYFVGQFAAPIKCLHEMYEMKIAGLREAEMLEEAAEFYRKIKIILQTTRLAEGCSLLVYDDKKQQAGDVIKEEIENYVRDQKA